MKPVKFSGKKRRSDRSIFRNRAYNDWKFNHLKYNEFGKIDFVDSKGREYVFNEIKRTNLMTSDYSDPPKLLTNKYDLSSFGDPSGLYYQRLSLSVRIPKRMDIEEGTSFPEPRTQITLFCKETGVTCKAEVGGMFNRPTSKSGAIELRDFIVIGIGDEVEFRNMSN